MFMIYGINDHERMPLDKLFKKPAVGKTHAITKEKAVKNASDPEREKGDNLHRSAELAYNAIDNIGKQTVTQPILLAEHIMTPSIVTLTPQTSIAQALDIFKLHSFRHYPVIASSGRLVGIISDRDLLRSMAGLSKTYQTKVQSANDSQIEHLMTQGVLTADVSADVRYIARLFVEQRIGAMPVAREGVLVGLITRSDVLGAVMRHYKFELWS